MAATKYAAGYRASVRRPESRALLGLLDSVCGGAGGVVELAGEAGAGKTRLLGELAEEAAARGLTVLRGFGDRTEWSVRGQLVVQALRGWLGPLGPGARHDEVLDVMRRIAAPPKPADSAVGCRTPALMRGLFERFHGGGMLIVLDDVHDADPGSLDLVDRLVNWPLNAPVGLVVSHRPRQDSERLAAILARGAELGTSQRLELGPLSLSQAAGLLDLPVESRWLRGLHRDARGLPLYLLALARTGPVHYTAGSLDTGTGGGPAESASAPLSDLVASRLATELAPLGAAERGLLACAAVLGDRFDTAAVAAVAELPEDETCRLLDELGRHDLVRQLPGGTELDFRHPLVRRAVYEQTEGWWRIAAHRRAVVALTARGAPAATLADHIERSSPGRCPLDVAVLTAAAREALRAHDSGLAHRRLAAAVAALSHAPHPGGDGGVPREEAARTLLALAEELAVRTGSRRRLAEFAARLERVPGRPAAGTAPAAEAPAEPSEELLRLADLTDREREIAELASTGVRSRDIAGELGLSPRTVEVHLSRIYGKLGIHSRAALTRLVVESRRTG